MVTMKSFNSFNIRQLQAYAGLCLWQFCNHFDIKHPLINELILHLVRILITSSLPDWEQDGASLAITGRGDSLPVGVLEILAPDNLDIFNSLVENCVEVGIVDMYGAPSDQPMTFLEQSIKILTSSGVKPPPSEMLMKYKRGLGVWGEPVDESELKEMLDAYGVNLPN